MISLLPGDCRDILAQLPAASIHCCVTSPPYFQLRDYNVAGQIGLESSPDNYLDVMVEVFRQVRRVLRDDGTLWLNIGDSYNNFRSSKGPGQALHGRDELRGKPAPGSGGRGWRGLKEKDLLMMPARLALALQADGWWLRSDIIWHKPNPMPESVKGSTVTRHMITLSDYERLSSVPRASQRADENRAGNLSDLPAGEVSDRQTSVSGECQGDSDSEGAGGTAGRAGKAQAVLGVGAGPSEPSEIRGDAQGQGDTYQAVSEISSQSAGQGRQCSEASADERQPDKAGAAPSGQQPISANRQGQGAQASGTCQTQGSDPFDGEDADCGGMEDDPASSQGALFLLPREGEDDAGPCDPAIEGRATHQDECGSGVRAVQLEEEQSADPADLVPCPGCDKCNNGYIFHLYAGRPTSSHEHVFLLTKSARYFYDADAVREVHNDVNRPDGFLGRDGVLRRAGGAPGDVPSATVSGSNPASGRNCRNVWTIATAPYSAAHFATYPPALAERCIRAGTSERGCCAACGAPWGRVTETDYHQNRTGKTGRKDATGSNGWDDRTYPNLSKISTTTGWSASCACGADTVPCTVLDPFAGAGTTLLVADRLQRDAIGVELNPDYTRMAMDRCRDDAPLFAEPSPPPAEPPEDERMADLFAEPLAAD